MSIIPTVVEPFSPVKTLNTEMVTSNDSPDLSGIEAGQVKLDGGYLSNMADGEPSIVNKSCEVCNVDPESIMLGFRNLSISTVNPPHHVVTGVSGFVVKGGITAVLGASGSGKSVLMKFLSGRLPHLSYTGDVTLRGRQIDPLKAKHGFGFVPQEDVLIGDITARETVEVAANLRRVTTKAQNAEEAAKVLEGLGLKKVADNVVGTILKRGLSGGEKRRVSVGQELVVRPIVCFLDEPSSGLDGTAAYDVMKVIKSYTAESNGNFSAMLSIHQPNLRILATFDHILLLGNGGSNFFGTLPEAIMHFTKIGHPPPPEQNPMDFFLTATDSLFAEAKAADEEPIDFAQEYQTSALGIVVKRKLRTAKVLAEREIDYGSTGDHKDETTGFWRQYGTLVKREAILAVRDPTLYWLQLNLHVFYGFLIGAVFWQLEPIMARITYLPGASVWCLMLNSYVHCFKVFYLNNMYHRYRHERANGSYTVNAFFMAELTVSIASIMIFIPGSTIAYFMIGFPQRSYGFYVLLLYIMNLTAEGMIGVLTKLSPDPAVGVVLAQAVLVVFTVFAGGLFIPLDQVPGYWAWLEELGLFTQGCRAFMLRVFPDIPYPCPTFANGICTYPNVPNFPCDVVNTATECVTNGLNVAQWYLTANKTNPWAYVGFLSLLMVAFRIMNYLLYVYPVDFIKQAFLSYMATPVQRVALETEMEVRRLRGEVNSLNKVLEQGSYCPTDTNGTGKTDDAGEDESLPLFHNHSTRAVSFSIRTQFLTFDSYDVVLPKNGKKLIDSVTGHATSGRVLAIMGPSGAGKTTLLNALSGRATYAKVSGAVRIGGRPMTMTDLDYVPQFDNLNEFFTVRESLEYMSNMKQVGTASEHSVRVAELIHILGLTYLADSRISNLTGGEKKRVSIGMGMVSSPSVLFLDEPTTGLDSSAAFGITRYIQRVSEATNVIVIMTIHQPSGQVFEMLQDLMLLEGGRLAYFGTRTGAHGFFESLGAKCPPQSNPADFYLDLISGNPVLAATSMKEDKESVVTWAKLYHASASVQASPDQKDSSTVILDKQPGSWPRFIHLTRNMTTYYWRNTTVHWLRLLELVVVAIYLGTLFLRVEHTTANLGLITGAIFFNTWCVLFAVIAAAPAFTVERRTALQEMLNGAYGPGSYCAAQFFASVPFTVAISIIYQAIYHYLVGYNDKFSAYVYAVLVTIELLFIMEGIMLSVVEVVKNDMISVTMSMVLLGNLFLFPGFFIQTQDIVASLRWASYIVPTRYSFNGLLYNTFHDVTYINSSYMPGDGSTPTVTGDYLLQTVFNQSSSENKWYDFAGLIGYVIFFRVCHYGIVYMGVRPYRRNASA